MNADVEPWGRWFELMPDGVLVTEADSIDLPGPRIVYVNRAFERDTGYLREEVIGRTPRVLQGPRTERAGLEIIRKALVDRAPCRVELLNYGKGGRECWAEMSISPFADANGTVTHFIGIRRDLTQVKQLGAALKKTREFLERTGQVAGVGGWEYEVGSGIVQWTAETRRMHGVPLDYMPTVEEAILFYDPGARDEIRMAVQRCVEDAVPYDLELPFTSRDGRKLWVRAQGQAELQDGRVVRIFGAFKDITERRKVTAARDQALARLQKIAERVPGMVYQFRLLPDGRCQLPFVSEAVRSIFRLSPEALCGDASLAFARHHPEDHEGVLASIHRSAQDLSPWNHEYRVRFEDGTVRWLLGNALPERETDGSILWHGFITDITERKGGEIALAKARAYYQTLLETASDGIHVLNQEGELLHASSSFYQMLGYAPGDPLLRHVGDWDAQWSIEELKARLQVRVHEPEIFQTRHRCKDGSIIDVEISSRSIEVDGGWCLYAASRDITERKRLEERLRQAQKLESIGQLAGGVAHDFNNILSAMMMHLSVLQGSTNLDPAIRESHAELMAGAQRAAALTRQLLLFSRRSVLGKKVLDLNEVVANLLKMLGRLIGEQVTIRFARQEGLPLVEADPGMLEQVLLNLAVNARDAMGDGGMLTISLRPFRLEAGVVGGGNRVEPGPFVCLSVTDTGCGMDEATRLRIFEPFFTTKEAGKGTGLGLATVHGIIGQHKGWVDVESQPGQGTSFRVYLPASGQGQVESGPPESRPAPRGHESILVVEDEAGLRAMISRGLRALGYSVVEAGNGPMAVALMENLCPRIDLLLTDMVMPGGMSGWALAQRLRERKPDLKVLLSSGYSAELVGRTEAPLAGVVYLPKPYTMETLSGKVRVALDGRGGV